MEPVLDMLKNVWSKGEVLCKQKGNRWHKANDSKNQLVGLSEKLCLFKPRGSFPFA